MNRSNILLLTAALMLSACAQMAATKAGNANPTTSTQPSATLPVPTASNPTSSRLDVLDFAESFGDLTFEQQKKELLQNNQNKGDLTSRIKIAMIYGLPNSKLRDTNKAQALLDELARDKNLDGDRKILTLIMRDYITENNKLGIKVRDEQKRADTLQQKLEDLKNIEKMMLEREQGNRK
jgi:Holliday junction resolvase RusA-like endonuclease